ncbi:GM16885 [Drosophila sechellia]|uniref:RNA-directed DNA polymerase n=1 Tax=Drosophila sechellia TaxID=7238 RepID=B4HLV3_DROSE|nr:GM25213 [Drosophila sechellia]EDW54718.1 GM16885 [Drosophila sechellia]
MKDDQPVKQRYYPKNHKMQVEISTKVNDLLEKGCIEPSRSPYNSPIVMGGKVYKQSRLKGRILADSVGSREPAIYGVYGAVKGPAPMESDAIWHSASATFQRALDHVIGPEIVPHAFSYQYDIIVIGRTLQKHMRNLKEVFQRLWAGNRKGNAVICKFFRKELQYLGHRVTDQGIGMDPEKVAEIARQKPPGNVKELRQCLGYASWYRHFVYDFATLVQPLNALFKARLVADPILACPDFTKTKLRPYLKGYLKWLNSIEGPSGRIARWVQQYDFEISYRKGQLNVVARQPLQETSGRVSVKDDEQSREQQGCRWMKEMRRKDGKLYRHIPHWAGNEDVASWKMCVPIGQRQRVITENHDMPTAGHLGSRKTIARIAARYHWPGMHRDIRKYVRSCESCMKYKPSQLQAAGKMLTQVPEEPCGGSSWTPPYLKAV